MEAPKVFSSSTKKDLTPHREKVREAVNRLKFLPEMMEYFIDRGADVETLVEALWAPNAASDQSRAFIDAALDQGLHAFELPGRDQRPNMAARQVRVVHLGILGRFFGDLDGLVVDGSFDQHPCRGVAGLACIVEAARGALLDSFLGCIGKDDVGTFSTQFERNTLQSVGSILGDRSAGAG